MASFPRKTRSVCPVCLKNIPARLEQREDGSVFLSKECPEHGAFSADVWRGNVDFDTWTQCAQPLGELGTQCPQNCGLCPEHESGSCCVLLEVTKRCDLRCAFCFADGGQQEADMPMEQVKKAIDRIRTLCGKPLLQLSGGEPTLRDDLPELVRYAKEAGCSYVQVNTNGLRLARDPEYAQALAKAGLDIVFLQFDGTRQEIYEKLRGRPLLEEKIRAIDVCASLGHPGADRCPRGQYGEFGGIGGLCKDKGSRGSGHSFSAGFLFWPLPGGKPGPVYPG